MRKGQTEILGFLVIIILLIVVGVLYLKFSTMSSEDVISETRTNIEISNFLSAVMKYTPCAGQSLEDAVKNCQNAGTLCGENACDLLEKELISAFSAYNLEVWQGKYSGYSLEMGDILIEEGSLEGTCLADSYKISTSHGLISISMVLCN